MMGWVGEVDERLGLQGLQIQLMEVWTDQTKPRRERADAIEMEVQEKEVEQENTFWGSILYCKKIQLQCK